MRPELRWLLVATVLASGLAMWWPQDVVEPVALTEGSRVGTGIPVESAAALPLSAAPASGSLLPPTLAKASLEPAAFDPFVGVTELPRAQRVLPPPPPKDELPAIPPPPPNALEPPEVLPVAPALSYRFLGHMTGPDGVQRAYLVKADVAIPVAVGTTLEEGYVVKELGAEGIRLHYPPLNADAVIPVPAATDPSPR